MSSSNVFLMAILSSLSLVKIQIVKTFTKDTTIFDKEFVDVILSNPENKKKLLEKLDQEDNNDIEVTVNGNNFSIITG